MEPTKAEVKCNWVFYTEVVKIEERTERVHVSGSGPDAVFDDISSGWWMQFKGSNESLHMGHERPDFHLGDKVKVTFERIL